MQNIWFVSDMHFGHKNILAYCNRPFDSIEEMNQVLVENWNKSVNPNDIVYCLGDMAFHDYECISRLNGYKILTPGNHDHERAKKVFPHVQEVTQEVHYLKLSKENRFVLCHYPFESWRREYRYHLHEHAHGSSSQKDLRLDVGIDATKLYRPIHLDEILNLL